MFSKRVLLAAALALAAAACKPAPEVTPAMWEVTGPAGQRAWLFGTIHALPDPVDWRSDKVEAALAASDRLVLEVAKINDGAALAGTFARLGQSPGLPPLTARVPPANRPALERVLADLGLTGKLDGLETWAAALTLQQGISAKSGLDSSNGVDRALVRQYRKAVGEFEGAEAQLGIFDRLAEDDQVELLLAVLRGVKAPLDDARRMEQAWATGDMAAITAETNRDFLTDPELRAALLTARNRAWTERLRQLMAAGEQPFVAVGAAHLAGPEGVPALLAAQGYTVRRVQ
ncbi:TraB/GumN family protein [Novosphingobium sp.]|uniref:TraB/GumN family protein n=1 Tax=Novosphingobium sp. TaxID=1874826 RepID=UPI002734D1B3|nr:TraB/GumN family protein [Novosphingobium sp.]MDP3905933.1 TraB/GumN family protein [Novosphingobium sp.]